LKILFILTSLLFFLFIGCSFHETQETKYPNGQSKDKYLVIKDKNGSYIRDGKYTCHYENGQIKEQGRYIHGQLFGLRRLYYKNGQKSFEETHGVKGLTHQISWYENGNKKADLSFNENGLADGIQTEWYDNGNLQSKTSIKNGAADGKHQQWYSDGKQNWDAVISQNKWDGIVTFFTSNGDTGFNLLCVHGKIAKINKLLPSSEKTLTDCAAQGLVEYSISRILNVSYARNYLNQVDCFSKIHGNIPDSLARTGISVYYSSTLPKNILTWFKRYEREFFYDGTYHGSVISSCKSVLPVLFYIGYNEATQRVQIFYFINWNESKNYKDFCYLKDFPNILSPIFCRANLIGVRFATPYIMRSIASAVNFNGYYLCNITDFQCIYRKPNDDYAIVTLNEDMRATAFTISIASCQDQSYDCVYDCRLGPPYTPSGQLSVNAPAYMFCGALNSKKSLGFSEQF
jgi:antitoxin component YwqK of YwqJK toxin-antitoxin module